MSTPTRRHRRHRCPITLASLFLASLAAGGCRHSGGLYCPTASPMPQYSVMAFSPDLQWTGVARSSSGRLFVNYPRWTPDRYEFAVAEVIGTDRLTREGSRVVPYPDAETNAWSPDGPNAGDWRSRFVAVQSVHIDRQDRMWVLDTGLVSRDADRRAVIYEVDLSTDTVRRSIEMPFEVAPEGSYLNDIRLTPDGRWAFVSESGLGAIIVLDVETGAGRRVLGDHPSTKGSTDRTPVVEGRPWTLAETGEPPVIHCDGIAVSPDSEWVYYQSISADRLYRVPVAALTDGSMSADRLASLVEDLGESVVTDGMIFDDAGNLYFSALEQDAIVYRTPGGEYKTLVADRAISWPDSFAIDRDNDLLVFTTAQIHRTPRFNTTGEWPTEPFRVMSIPLPE